MIEAILPGTVVSVASRGDLDVELFPAEAEAIRHAVAKRRSEFVTARACAREAYARLGVPPEPVVPGPHGEPSWASGVVGSITHCDGYRACAIARATDVSALGIDAEPHAALPFGLLADVALPEERRALAELAARWPGTCWDRLLFSAKEAAYKAWFPLLRRRLAFGDAVVTFGGAAIAPDRGDFEIQLLASAAGDGSSSTRLGGSWLIRGGIAATAIARVAGESR